MKTTVSTNIQSFGKNQSYLGLRQKHFDEKTRNEKKISVDEELTPYNTHWENTDFDVESFYQQAEDELISYNMKPSQKKNPSRQHKDLKSYVDSKQKRKNVDKNFHGIEFMMVNKFSNMDDWDDFKVSCYEKGIDKFELATSMNLVFDEFQNWFNDEFNKYGLNIVETDTNVDELGSPHLHARVLLDKKLSNGLQDTNLSNVLKARYGAKTNKQLMKEFRYEVDSYLMDSTNEVMKMLYSSKNLNYKPFELVRTHAEDVGKSQEKYIQDRDHERKLEELNQRESKLNDRELSLNARERHLNARESDLNNKARQIDVDKEKARKERKDARDFLDDAKSLRKAVRILQLDGDKDLSKYLLGRFSGKNKDVIQSVLDDYNKRQAKLSKYDEWQARADKALKSADIDDWSSDNKHDIEY